MEIIYLIGAMVVVGIFIGWLAGFIWKDNQPIGEAGDYIAAIITTVVVGLIDWYVIPAMGFSDRLRYISVAIEPALGALIVLWIIRKAKS